MPIPTAVRGHDRHTIIALISLPERSARDGHIRNPLRRGPIGAISGRSGSLRLAAQDVALSRRKQGFESPRERHADTSIFSFQRHSAWFGTFGPGPPIDTAVASELGCATLGQRIAICIISITFGFAQRFVARDRHPFVRVWSAPASLRIALLETM